MREFFVEADRSVLPHLGVKGIEFTSFGMHFPENPNCGGRNQTPSRDLVGIKALPLDGPAAEGQGDQFSITAFCGQTPTLGK